MNISNAILKLNQVMPEQAKVTIRRLVPVGLKRYLGKVVMRDLSNSTSVTTSTDGRKFRTIEDRVFLRVLLDGTYEPDMTAVGKQLVHEGDIVIDVGANFGWYSTLFGKCVGESGSVISYEPLEHSNNVLNENVKLNGLQGVIKTNKNAVGEICEEVLIGCSNEIESGLAHIVDGVTNNGVAIECVSLDSRHSADIGKISFLKIDIEGYEKSALQGALKLLDCADQPVLQIELNELALQRAGSCRSDILDLLTTLGYKFYEPCSVNRSKITLANLDTCSDVFCLGKGKFSSRAQSLIV